MAKVRMVNLQNYGYMLCEAGRYDEGADQFDKSIEFQPDDYWRWYITAAARLRAGNLPKYRETCEKMLARLRNTDDPQAAADVAKVILLGPDQDEPDPAVLELARRAMAKEAGHPSSPWIRLAKAIADYRADRFDDSRAILEQLLKEPEDPERYASAKYLLAMIQWREEKQDEARTSFAQARQYQDEHPVRGYAGSWLGRAMVEFVCREAEGLIRAGD
jgi:tetratricopeptide (TPR) repeat protein